MSYRRTTYLSPVLQFTHHLMQQRLKLGDTAVDATLGNGHDTLYLRQLTGDQGQVIGFDIQAQALESTRQRLQQQDLMSGVQLIHDSHAHLRQYISHADLVVFNLGYLPGADKAITTQVDSTIPALEASLQILNLHGLLLVVVYPGHPAGQIEDETLQRWVRALPTQDYQVIQYGFINSQQRSPYLLAIEKINCP